MEDRPGILAVPRSSLPTARPGKTVRPKPNGPVRPIGKGSDPRTAATRASGLDRHGSDGHRSGHHSTVECGVGGLSRPNPPLLSRPREGVRWTIIPPDAHGQGDTLFVAPDPELRTSKAFTCTTPNRA